MIDENFVNTMNTYYYVFAYIKIRFNILEIFCFDFGRVHIAAYCNAAKYVLEYFVNGCLYKWVAAR